MSKKSGLLGVPYKVSQTNLKQNPQLLSILAYSKTPNKKANKRQPQDKF